jgi:hypothetical protein
VHAIDKNGKIKIIVVKTFKVKAQENGLVFFESLTIP